ncbi:MAG: hypothetical protein ABW321_34080 [Polyangiales bacterium]
MCSRELRPTLERRRREVLLLIAFTLAAIGCDVYDPSLLPGPITRQDAGGHNEPPDAGDDSGTQPDAEVDAGYEPVCTIQENPECPLRCSEVCNGVDDDCDGTVDERQGAAGSFCTLPHAISVCARGSCLIASCEDGHVDCNGDAADGCEATLDSVAHCGVCTHACDLPHAAAACNHGRCAIAQCLPGYADCDQRIDNGCERPLDTLNDCGSCGADCRVPRATSDCSTGACRFAGCNAGFGDCNNDADALGQGDGCETDLGLPESCGACGKVCPPSAPYCAGGQCTAISCPADAADCNGDNLDCETSLHSVDHCGACGASCGSPANATVDCGSGICVPTCQDGFTSCDETNANGCETDLRTETNCGSCGVTCTYTNALTSCSSGSCQLTGCSSGFGNCNGADADGCEQRLNTNTHCAQCNQGCSLGNATASCSSGSCQVASCNGGFGNCDGSAANGCEVDLSNNPQHCGACGQACTNNFACQSGRCVCTSNSQCGSGQTCCGGSCKNLATDASNCGSCGRSCGSGLSCCSGTCKNLATDMDNCGSCGRQCDDEDTNRCTSGQCRCSSDAPCSGFYKCCSSGCKITLVCF